ncbi:PepSY domain-containing protein [Aurantiacibacter gilvus]|uniref:PepSY domain-containing protein n=1 Tax=Aurantiacibacter gilvus TaxID=3139141 RepID=A0ABU9IFF3_9SPHN
MWRTTKYWLYFIHRWIGIATCLLFVLWFASGLVMLYAPFPSLEEAEELEGLPPIAWEQVDHGPDAAATASSDLREIILEMRGDRPVWRLSPWEAPAYAIWADTGTTAGPADEAEARENARLFGGADVSDIRLIHNDQWTVPGGYDLDRPLWKVELAGEAGRVLYVSSVDGSVVLDTSSRERFWNWLGSVPHWLYPRALREDQPLWRQVVMWVSGPCIIVAITGIWIGLTRLRMGRRRFSGGNMTPYRGWMKWHHVSGLIGSAFLLLWIFSGWLSVDPGRLFASEGVSPEAVRDYAGAKPLPAPDLAILSQVAGEARRVMVNSAAGQAQVRIQQPGTGDTVLNATSYEPLAVDEQQLRQSASSLLPGAAIVDAATLTEPDAYWYAVHGEVPLPVLRFRFDDPAETWVHIDPATGQLLAQSDSRRRTYRWLFDLFHRWDLNVLLETGPARDVLIWLMSLFGLISSVTAVYIGWKRLKRPSGARPQD